MEKSDIIDNKRIAKNTLFLYFRTMLTLFVALFTSRVILNTLGLVDFGLNSVVAGVITLFAFLNNALGASSSRFLTFELGKQSGNKLKEVFSTSFSIHLGLAIIVVILCETVGLWIVNNVLVIPNDRIFACNVIYQYVIITAVLSITQVPLNAMVIANERMTMYAYLGISEAILKLTVAYLITISPFDKLITFGTLNLFIAFGIYAFYHLYCRRNFMDYNITISRNKELYKKMIGYSAWSVLGASAGMAKTQGINILINIFFGPVVNAANTIAYQVNGALSNFYNNFTTAINPQIIKSYAAEEHHRMKSLIFIGGKFSFFLLMIFSIPIILETNIILHLWLETVPEYTVTFTRLIILLTLIESFVATIGMAIQATGRIRDYQIFISGIYLLIFPLAYTAYKLGAAPFAALTILLVLASINIFVRLFFLKRYIHINVLDYSKNVLFVSVVVMLLSLIFPVAIYNLMSEGLLRLLTVVIVSMLSSIISIYLFGLQKVERQKVRTFIKKKMKSK